MLTYFRRILALCNHSVVVRRRSSPGRRPEWALVKTCWVLPEPRSRSDVTVRPRVEAPVTALQKFFLYKKNNLVSTCSWGRWPKNNNQLCSVQQHYFSKFLVLLVMYVIFFNSVSDVFIGKKDTALQKFFFLYKKNKLVSTCSWGRWPKNNITNCAVFNNTILVSSEFY